MDSTGRNLLGHRLAFSRSAPEMPFARAHNPAASRRRPGFAGPRRRTPASPPDHQQRMVHEKYKQQSSNHDGGADYLPSMTLRPSHTAPTRPVTIMVITALNV